MRLLFRTAPLALLLSSLLAAQTPAPLEPGLYGTLTTNMGPIKFRLFEKETPETVKNFMGLADGKVVWTDPRNGLPAKVPFYDGLTFHRVIPNFMIQGGDPLGDGTGGTATVPDEIRDELKFDQPGRLGMANSGPNTSSCQFFITEVETPHLNGLHTVFGQVVDGLETVKRIARVPVNNDRPNSDVVIESITFERVKPAVAKKTAVAKKAVSKTAVSKKTVTKKSAAAPKK